MKKSIYYLLPLFFIIASCNKYEDGPTISLRTKKQRLMNSWVIGQVFETPSGGAQVDKTTDYKNFYYNYNLIISDNNQYGLTYSALNLLPYAETGSWALTATKEHVLFSNSNTNQSSAIGSRWRILRLKEDELWAETEQSNGTLIEAHFIQQ